jgi:hypothetical protein
MDPATLEEQKKKNDPEWVDTLSRWKAEDKEVAVEIFQSVPDFEEFIDYGEKHPDAAMAIEQIPLWYQKLGQLDWAELVQDDYFKFVRYKKDEGIVLEGFPGVNWGETGPEGEED